MKLITRAVALMAAVVTGPYVDREAARAGRRGDVEGTSTVPLMSPALRRLEADQLKHLLHADLLANPFEVNTGHHGSFRIGGAGEQLDRSVPSLSL
jgi:hypothetical protein